MTTRATTRPKPAATWRVCLRCDNDFMSEGPGNRVCPPCTIANAKVGTPACRVRGLLPDKADEDEWGDRP